MVTFESIAHEIMVDGKKMVGAWTDGLMIVADNERFCAMNLRAGSKYRISVQQVTDEPIQMERKP